MYWRNLFQRKPKEQCEPERQTVTVRCDAHRYEVGGCWGHHIEFLDFVTGQITQRICGHMPRKPCNGDVLTAHMDSGRTAVFVICGVEYLGNPPDMFFANASFIGYEDEGALEALSG